MSEYHIPVMFQECIDALEIEKGGVYVDVTYGSGAHSRGILNQLGEDGRLFSFDQDADVFDNISSDERLVFIKSNFRYLYKMLRLEGVAKVDGLLADLGVSSHQLDFPERGFSFRFDAPLDMRMNERSDLTAKDVIRDYDAAQLQEVFSAFGEVRNARTLAQAIVKERGLRAIETTFDLNEVLEPIWKGQKNRYYAQVYQALRMEVNEEMVVLEDMLQDVLRVLKPGGLLVVMSYHSLEDRAVKNFMKTGNVKGEMVKDDFGKIDRPFKILTKKPVMASDEEVERNPRARSAKLRVAKRL